MSGVELAHIARKRNPDLDVVVTSGSPLPEPLPDGAKFWSKPWAPLDVMREAELAQAKGTADWARSRTLALASAPFARRDTVRS